MSLRRAFVDRTDDVDKIEKHRTQYKGWVHQHVVAVQAVDGSRAGQNRACSITSHHIPSRLASFHAIRALRGIVLLGQLGKGGGGAIRA